MLRRQQLLFPVANRRGCQVSGEKRGQPGRLNATSTHVCWVAPTHSIPQTDGCLRQLAARLCAAGVGTALLATAAAGGSPTLSGSPQVPSAPGSSASGAGADPDGGIAALGQSHEAWNQLATAIQASGVQQPELLTGGLGLDGMPSGSGLRGCW